MQAVVPAGHGPPDPVGQQPLRLQERRQGDRPTQRPGRGVLAGLAQPGGQRAQALEGRQRQSRHPGEKPGAAPHRRRRSGPVARDRVFPRNVQRPRA
eukprot:1200742-Alexandrium_andersonii.AAC.1